MRRTRRLRTARSHSPGLSVTEVPDSPEGLGFGLPAELAEFGEVMRGVVSKHLRQTYAAGFKNGMQTIVDALERTADPDAQAVAAVLRDTVIPPHVAALNEVLEREER